LAVRDWMGPGGKGFVIPDAVTGWGRCARSDLCPTPICQPRLWSPLSCNSEPGILRRHGGWVSPKVELRPSVNRAVLKSYTTAFPIQGKTSLPPPTLLIYSWRN
jgi:hypothetical protein